MHRVWERPSWQPPLEQLRQPTAAWVASCEAEMKAMRTELAELREFQRMTLEAEERVRA